MNLKRKLDKVRIIKKYLSYQTQNHKKLNKYMNLKHIVISESITKSNIPRISSCGKSGA